MEAMNPHVTTQKQGRLEAGSELVTPTPVGLVWDLPVRIFHGLFAVCFVVAWVTAESERWRLVHVTAGYTFGGLLVFRLLWGFVGSHHARFSSFVRGPGAVWRYVSSVLDGEPEHHVGHNPAGGLAIVGMLGLAAVIVTTGWMTYNEIGGDSLPELHEAVATGLLTVVLVHVIAVIASSRIHHENLPLAMVTGRKRSSDGAPRVRRWRSVGLALLVAVLAFWVQQWRATLEVKSGLPLQTEAEQSANSSR